MSAVKSTPTFSGETLFERLYLIVGVVILGSILAYFLLHTTGSSGGISAREGTEVASASPPPSALGILYTITLWLVIPALLVTRLIRIAPRRPQILVEGKFVPTVHVKKTVTTKTPGEQAVTTE